MLFDWRNAFVVLSLAAAFGSTTATLQTPAASGATIYEGARLITGDASPAVESGAFVVQGDRITAIGPRGSVTAPAGATRVDLTGKTVIPALIDGHTHVGNERFRSAALSALSPTYAQDYTAGNIVDHLQRYAYYGVGSIFNAGNDAPRVAQRVKTLQAAGKLAPAAQFHWAPGIAPPEGGIDQILIRATGPLNAIYEVTRAKEARSAVQDAASRGADGVKIWYGDRNGDYPAMPRQIWEAVIDEAQKQGIVVQGHALTLQDQKDAVGAGIPILAHAIIHPVMTPADDALVELVRQRKPYWTDMGAPGEFMACDTEKVSFMAETYTAKLMAEFKAACNRPFDMSLIPESGSQSPEQAAEIQQANFTKFVKAGARVFAGTDSGVVSMAGFGHSLHNQIWGFVKWGMTPAQAIMAGTSVPAEALRLKDVGVLATGKFADFVVLDANPLENIENTRTINAVYLRGRKLDREALKARWQRGDAIVEP